MNIRFIVSVQPLLFCLRTWTTSEREPKPQKLSLHQRIITDIQTYFISCVYMVAKTPKKKKKKFHKHQSEYWKQNSTDPNRTTEDRAARGVWQKYWHPSGTVWGINVVWKLFLQWWILFPFLFSILHLLLMYHMQSSNTLSGAASKCAISGPSR